jgi:hypothetical protein
MEIRSLHRAQSAPSSLIRCFSKASKFAYNKTSNPSRLVFCEQLGRRVVFIIKYTGFWLPRRGVGCSTFD